MVNPGIVAAALVAMSTLAYADKPTIVIVGVEGQDPVAAKVADKLNPELRRYAGAKSGRYQPKGSAKEIAAAILKTECKIIEPACATAIGTIIAADYVLTGVVESRANHQTLLLSLVKVQTKSRLRSLRESVATTSDIKRWARTTYERLVDDATGDLSISSNAQRGDIWVDGALMAGLFEGRVTLTGLALGSHQIGVRAKGYKPLDVELTIDNSTKQSFLLEPLTP